MKEYSEVVQFSYKGELYKLFIDDNGERFYLKTDENGKLFYVNIREFIELENIFAATPYPLARPLVPDSKGYPQYSNSNNNHNNYNIKKNSNKRKKIRLIPKVIIGGTLVALSTIAIDKYIVKHPNITSDENKYSIEKQISTVSDNTEENPSLETIEEPTTEAKEKYNPNIFETSSAASSIRKELKVDTYYDGKEYYYIYDMAYLDKTPYKNKPTKEEVLSVLNNNSKIPNEFRDIMTSYVDDLYKTYPNIDCRNLIQNFKTIEVDICSKRDMEIVTGSEDSIGCYLRNDNKICVLESEEYGSDMWSKQVIYHELSHCLRQGNFTIDGIDYTVRAAGSGFRSELLEEALNSNFAVSLFGYEERDIAYQLQSNIVKTMVECMDSYTFEDYAIHSISYFLQKLDEYTGDDNYAMTMMALMEFQYDDYHSDRINAEQSEYYRLYDYVSDFYYKNHITSDMSYDDAKLVTDDLLEKILYDVPEEYNIDVNHFYDHLKDYCKEKGIEVKEKTK